MNTNLKLDPADLHNEYSQQVAMLSQRCAMLHMSNAALHRVNAELVAALAARDKELADARSAGLPVAAAAE